MDLDADADEEFGGDDDDDTSTVPGFPREPRNGHPRPRNVQICSGMWGPPPTNSPPTYSLAFVAFCLGIPLHLIAPLLDPCL